MALTEHYYTKFECNKFYHVYNRSVDRKPLFKSKNNYIYFLKRYDEYLLEYVDTYAYCLLGNHFHLLILIKDLTTFQKLSNLQSNKEQKSAHDIVSHQFKKFFQSYAMAFNKQQDRIGTLFQTPFKRVLVENHKYIENTITYIHKNPEHHGLVDDFREWEWSSYHRILIDKVSKLKKKEVLAIYDSKEKFKESHTIGKIDIPEDLLFYEEESFENH